VPAARPHDAEHRRRAADAETERCDHHAGICRVAANLPDGVAGVLHRLLDPADAVHVAKLLPHHRGVAELPPCRDVGLVG
jgi:hypothetical protein